LRYRPRSVAEARVRLTSLGFREEEVEEVLHKAESAGLLDDDVFTRLWVEDRLLHHPLSRRAVRLELADKGIDPQIIATTIERLYPADKERVVAVQLARARFARYRTISRDRRIKRTVSFLTRRGFSLSLAVNTVRAVEREEENNEPEDVDREFE